MSKAAPGMTKTQRKAAKRSCIDRENFFHAFMEFCEWEVGVLNDRITATGPERTHQTMEMLQTRDHLQKLQELADKVYSAENQSDWLKDADHYD